MPDVVTLESREASQTGAIQVAALDHLVLRVADLDRAIKFYGDVLGCHVERRDLNRASFRSFSTLQRSYVGHCQLLSIAVDHLTAIRPGLACRLLRVIAAETGPIVTRRHENAGCAMRAFRPGRGRRCDPCPFGRIAPLRAGPRAARPVR